MSINRTTHCSGPIGKPRPAGAFRTGLAGLAALGLALLALVAAPGGAGADPPAAPNWAEISASAGGKLSTVFLPEAPAFSPDGSVAVVAG
ncbi:MAG: hypothetical protein LBQ06_03125, partial [Frankiaceae bacterium]|nr:hypothetical protein [Frankiaceae bacterium]